MKTTVLHSNEPKALNTLWLYSKTSQPPRKPLVLEDLESYNKRKSAHNLQECWKTYEQ